MRISLWAIPVFLLTLTLQAQFAHRGETAAQPRRTRLYLKDGSYQIVMSYTVAGTTVRYLSAERGGESEDIPLALVDLPRTERWSHDHAPTSDEPAQQQGRPAPALDPELAREEADRASMTPEIAPDLRLPAEDSLLVLDNFHDEPELLPLLQTDGQLTRGQTHNILKSIVNPRASAHPLIVLKEEKAAIQLHVNGPAFYVHLDEDQPGTGGALTVDTHGASAAAGRTRPSSSASEYVIVRLDVRQDARVVPSVNPALLGAGKPQQDVIEADAIPMPGNHWLKVTPREPLLIGEYALMEVLNERELNLGVWDFGVHPTAPENRDAIHPEKRRRNSLERRN